MNCHGLFDLFFSLIALMGAALGVFYSYLT